MQDEVVDAVPEAVIEVNPRGGIEVVDLEAERLFGWAAQDLIGCRIDVLVADRQAADPGHRPAGVDLLLSARRRDGSQFPAEVSLTALPRGTSAHPVSLTIRDSTRRLDDEARSRASAPDADQPPAPRTDDLEEQAGGIADDLTNLLGVILNYGELVDRVVDDRCVREDLAKLRAAAERATQLTGRLALLAHRSARGADGTVTPAPPRLDEDLLLQAIRSHAAPERERQTVGVVVVDDHRMFAESLARLLGAEDDIEVRGVGANGREAVTLVERFRPEVLLLDQDHPEGDGVLVAAEVKRRWPSTMVVMISGSTDDRLLLRAIEAGCSGFLNKNRAASEVANAVRVVAAGEALISPAQLAMLLPKLATPYRGVGWDLTEREREVLVLLARGLTNKGIAAELFLSVNTIRNYVQAVLAKLGAHSKLEAVAIAQGAGILEPKVGPERAGPPASPVRPMACPLPVP